MISIFMQIAIIFLLLFCLFAFLFARALKNEDRIWVLIVFAILAMICLAIGEVSFYFHVKMV